MTFTVTNPNKWLHHMAEKYPDDAAGFDDVSNYIDNLRHACGVSKNHLDQIIGTASQGIAESEKIWSPTEPTPDREQVLRELWACDGARKFDCARSNWRPAVPMPPRTEWLACGITSNECDWLPCFDHTAQARSAINEVGESRLAVLLPGGGE